ncbi:MAG TPA: glycosyltransferase family 2 protein [Fibrobacteria bacterium]|nr:glycosyltransferase family 2 protein [Fibrobacteria bacterium]
METSDQTRPLVSVVLPFFRNPLVVEAVESILNQTFRDFELLAIDDCSGNGVARLLDKFDDPRLRLIEKDTNGGENATRNLGISMARGKYIAFQDHDDISYPDRLGKQVAFLESNPDVLGCGTACHYGDAHTPHLVPASSRLLRWEMIFNNHVMFPTVMVRSSFAKRHPFGDMVATDDYRWLFELLQEGEFANLPEILFHYRMQPTSLSREKAEIQLANLDICRARFAESIGVSCDPKEISILRMLGTPQTDSWESPAQLREAASLLGRLIESFCRKHPGAALPVKMFALARLRFAATVSSGLGSEVYWDFRRFRKELGFAFSVDETKLALKILLGFRRGKSLAP